MKRLKELRLEKKLYQKDVASAIGIDRTTYVKYELGQSEPNHEILQRIADFFDVSIDYLMCRTDIKKTPENESSLLQESKEILNAYESADNSIKIAIRKLLDL